MTATADVSTSLLPEHLDFTPATYGVLQRWGYKVSTAKAEFHGVQWLMTTVRGPRDTAVYRMVGPVSGHECLWRGYRIA